MMGDARSQHRLDGEPGGRGGQLWAFLACLGWEAEGGVGGCMSG